MQVDSRQELLIFLLGLALEATKHFSHENKLGRRWFWLLKKSLTRWMTWIKINRQACGTIRLYSAKDQKYFVVRETSTKKL